MSAPARLTDEERATLAFEVHAALLPLPQTLSAILLDQLTCARASVLLLNAYSTFSQIVMGRIGLARPKSLGWVRDLNRRQQQELGVQVRFWRREDPVRVGKLV